MTKIKHHIIKWYDEIKPSVSQDFSNVRNETDQRCPINNPQELYDQYVTSDLYKELEEEKIEDFDNDVYEYEERAEYGEDVAAALSVQREPPRRNKNPPPLFGSQKQEVEENKAPPEVDGSSA